MKIEFGLRDGYFVALSPKAYMAYNSETEECKKGNKGIPHSEKVQLDTFLKILLENHNHEVELRTLQMDVHNRMTRQGKMKAGLSDISVKVHVADDKITCSALKQNNKYLYLCNHFTI